MKMKAWWSKIKKLAYKFFVAMVGPFDDSPRDNYDNWWMN